MGADGGLYWMGLRDPQHKARVVELLRPLTLLDNSWHDSDYEWVRKNPLPDDAIVSSYATGNAHEGIQTLHNILEAVEGVEIATTFEEVALDLATRPLWQLTQLSPWEELVLIVTSRGDWYATRSNQKPDELGDVGRPARIVGGIPALGALRAMSISTWADLLKFCLRWKTVESVETWT